MSEYSNTILITGGTNGLGYEAALAIAKAQPSTQVVIASRSDKEHAADRINKELGQSNVVFQSLDLSEMSNIRNFVAHWNKQNYAPVSSLVLNAALQFPASEPVYSKDGIEMTFAITHVGHALLFYLMRPHLQSNCRIVITASGVHDPEQKTGIPDALYTSVEELAHPSGDALKVYGAQRYSTSKLCNVLWTYALDRRIKELQRTEPSLKWTVTTMDPGLMPGTALSRAYPAPLPWIMQNLVVRLIWLLRLFLGPNVHPTADSGRALARLAIANDVEGVSGKYFEGLKERNSSKASYELSKQEEIWQGTIDLIAKDDAERKSFTTL